MLFKNIFALKIWRVVEVLIQHATRCEIFVLKCDALEKFKSKSDKF